MSTPCQMRHVTMVTTAGTALYCRCVCMCMHVCACVHKFGLVHFCNLLAIEPTQIFDGSTTHTSHESFVVRSNNRVSMPMHGQLRSKLFKRQISRFFHSGASVVISV